MRKFKFSKLVRDKIVEGMVGLGDIPHWHVLGEEEYLNELKKKVFEEASEIPLVENNEELVKELADIQEIIDTLKELLNVDEVEFKRIQNEKSEKSGKLKKRHYVEYIDVQNTSPKIEYYLRYPEKYPEIK